MRANTVMPLALTASSSLFMVSRAPRWLLIVVNPGTCICALHRGSAHDTASHPTAPTYLPWPPAALSSDRHAFCRWPHYIIPMPTLIAGVVAVIVLYSLLQMFRAANPAVLARAIRIVGGVVALAVAAFTGIRGELAVAIPLGLFGAGLLGWSPFGTTGFGNFGGLFGGGTQRSPGQSSRVRSQYLDMTLDHDSGQLSGQIMDGPNAGHSLDEFDLP